MLDALSAYSKTIGFMEYSTDREEIWRHAFGKAAVFRRRTAVREVSRRT